MVDLASAWWCAPPVQPHFDLFDRWGATTDKRPIPVTVGHQTPVRHSRLISMTTPELPDVRRRNHVDDDSLSVST